MTSTAAASAAMTSNRIRHASLEILNCGLKASKEEIAEALQKLGISGFTKITKAQNEPKCRVTFPSDEAKNEAIGIITSNPVTTDDSEGPWRVKSVSFVDCT